MTQTIVRSVHSPVNVLILRSTSLLTNRGPLYEPHDTFYSRRHCAAVRGAAAAWTRRCTQGGGASRVYQGGGASRVYQGQYTRASIPGPVFPGQYTRASVPGPVFPGQCTEASVPRPVYRDQCTEASVPRPVYLGLGSRTLLEDPF